MNLDNAILAYKAAKAAGFTGAALLTAVAIAGAESAFNPSAVGDVAIQTEKWGPSIGLWQIRSLTENYLDMEPIRDSTRLSDPYYNAKAAYQISKRGTDFSPWSTFASNAYRQYEEIAHQADVLASDLKKNWIPILVALVLIAASLLYLKYN